MYMESRKRVLINIFARSQNRDADIENELVHTMGKERWNKLREY